MKLLALVVAAVLAFAWSAHALENEVSGQCLRCLCEGSTKNCDRTAGCDNYGYCGPFRLSKHYWEEAGSPEGDFEKCAKEYQCAEKTVKTYMQKFGTDCDGDGDVDCMDYALIHHKGRHGCPYQDFQSDSLYKYVSDCMQRHGGDPQDKSHHARQESHHDITSAGRNIQEGAQEQAHKLKDQTQHVGEDIKHRSENIGENIKGSLKDASENVQSKFHDAKDKVQDSARNLKEGIHSKLPSSSSHSQDQFEPHHPQTEPHHHDVDQQLHHRDEHKPQAMPEIIRQRRGVFRR